VRQAERRQSETGTAIQIERDRHSQTGKARQAQPYRYECHIAKGEPINLLIPRGYKVVVKRWRSAHGGGLLILALEHLLCDPIKLEKYHKDESAEMIGMRYGGISYVDVYTNKSALCKHLVGALQQLKHDMPDNSFVFVGDFNAHNRDWILCESPTNEAGELIEEFAQIQGLNQFVDFPTRMNNTLDLILSDADGSATASAPLGTSDHISIKFEVQVKHCVSEK